MNKSLLREWGRDILRGIRWVLWGPEVKTPTRDKLERMGRLLSNRPVDAWRRRDHD